MATKKKYYVVWDGHQPGIYESWTDCQLQVKGYPNARYKAFKSKAEAQEAYGDDFRDHMSKGGKKPLSPTSLESFDIVWDSIAVDAACSGNPGKMEYQGVDTKTGYQFFHHASPLGTNNIGEFLALVHALAYLKKEGKNIPVYTDSRNAIKWIQNKKCKTTLKRGPSTQKLFELITRAEQWLEKNTFTTKILKWDTKNWGEIPADFGRK